MAKTYEFVTMEKDKEQRKIAIREMVPNENQASINDMKWEIRKTEISINDLLERRNYLIDMIKEVSTALSIELEDALPDATETDFETAVVKKAK